ncbi:RHS repeat-associated core domain-containing protein [Nocardia sp. NPDC003345]
MFIAKAFVSAGSQLSGIAKNIATGWGRHSPNHDGALAGAATTHLQVQARAAEQIRGAAPHGPADTPGGQRTQFRDGQHDATVRTGRDRGLARTALTNRSETNRTSEQVTVCNDPVDVATGEFVMPDTDLRLPGVLPLVLRRRHRSNFRFGRWFGPSWSATLDMRVVVDIATVTFVGEDGLLLVYPHPEQGQPVFPANGGPRWALRAAEGGGYSVTDPEHELVRMFTTREPGTVDRRRGGYALSALTDRFGNRISFHYAVDGAPVAIEHSGGYRVDIECENGRITALRVPGSGDEDTATVREFGYDRGWLETVTNGVGATTRYTYDTEHRMTSWTDSNGNRMRNSYDAAGRVVAQHGTAGILDARFEYSTDPDSGARRTVHIDSTGAATEYVLDSELRLCEHIDPAGGRTRTEYGGDHRPARVVAPDGAVTTYRHNADGDTVEVIRPDGQAILISYTDRRRVSAVTAAGEPPHIQEWNDSGAVTAVVGPGGARTEFGRHPGGAVTVVTESTGAVTEIEVDPAGLPVRVIDAHGAVTTITRNRFGRPAVVTDGLGGITTYTWSGDDRLTERTHPDGYRESWEYDGEGNLLAHTDRAGGRTRYVYGAFDLVSSRTDPDGATTRYTWDTQRRLTGITNPLGDTWHYAYDRAGRCVAETEYSGALTRYGHDPCGRITTVTPATGITRTHTYDILGRPTGVTAATGEWLRYGYDAAGRMTTAVSGTADRTAHSLRFTHTSDGQPATEQVDGRPPSVFEHDRHGRRVSRTSPSGMVTTWQYDEADRVTAMNTGDRRLDFVQDHLGRATGWRVGALTVDRDYSPVGHTVAQTVGVVASGASARTPIFRDDYSLRADGYPTAQSTVAGAGPEIRREYELDEIGRITAITSGERVVERYRYDRLGNIRTGGAEPARAIDEPVPPNRPDPLHHREYRDNVLVRHGRTRFRYDESGRLIRSITGRPSRRPEVRQYRYNAFDQLTELRTSGGQRWRYTYDALGRRTAKYRLTAAGAALERTDYTWDGPRLTEQTAGDATTHWSYHPGTHIPLTQTLDRDGADREFVAVVTGPSGAPIRLLTDSGQVAATATSTLWGETTWSGYSHTLLRFPGQQYDPESGLHYNLHRVYDPAIGRYLTRDPLGPGPAANPVAYPHNPLTWCDPLGLIPRECEADRTYRDFAHGTSADHAEYIMTYGLNQQVAATASRGGSMSRRGSFFTHEVENGSSPGFQAAYEWGLRHSQYSPSTVLVGRLPESTYQELVGKGLVTVRKVGDGVPDETIFAPGSFTTLNDQMDWKWKVTPEVD